MHAHVVCPVDGVAAGDGPRPEAQVADRQPTTLVCIVVEAGLHAGIRKKGLAAAFAAAAEH